MVDFLLSGREMFGLFFCVELMKARFDPDWRRRSESNTVTLKETGVFAPGDAARQRTYESSARGHIRACPG